jgi:head-tail adaptor
MAEFAGALTERVRFERRVGPRGGGGELTEQWETVCSCAAHVVPEGRARSSMVGDGWRPGRRWKVTIRQGPTLSLDMRMAWRGQTLRVAGLELDPGEADRLSLWVEDLEI